MKEKTDKDAFVGSLMELKCLDRRQSLDLADKEETGSKDY